MKFVLSILLLIICNFASGQTGYKQELADYLSVVFPEQPIRIDTLGSTNYRFVDSLAIYIATIRTGSQDDPVLNAAELSDYYEGVIEGILKATNGKLISKKAFYVDSLKGIDFTYTTPEELNIPDLRFQRIIFINNTLFTINLLTTSENKTLAEAVRNEFFNSFAVNTSVTKLTQGEEHPSAIKLGTIFSKFIIWVLTYGVLIVGVIIIVYVIKRLLSRSK